MADLYCHLLFQDNHRVSPAGSLHENQLVSPRLSLHDNHRINRPCNRVVFHRPNHPLNHSCDLQVCSSHFLFPLRIVLFSASSSCPYSTYFTYHLLSFYEPYCSPLLQHVHVLHISHFLFPLRIVLFSASTSCPYSTYFTYHLLSFYEPYCSPLLQHVHVLHISHFLFPLRIVLFSASTSCPYSTYFTYHLLSFYETFCAAPFFVLSLPCCIYRLFYSSSTIRSPSYSLYSSNLIFLPFHNPFLQNYYNPFLRPHLQ